MVRGVAGQGWAGQAHSPLPWGTRLCIGQVPGSSPVLSFHFIEGWQSLAFWPSLPITAVGTGCWTPDAVLGTAAQPSAAMCARSGPSHLPPGLFYFHSRPWEDGAQPCLLCWLFKKEFIYEHLVAAPLPADLGIITLVTQWQQNTDYFWGQYRLVLFSISYIIIGWMKVCGAINLLFPSRITSRPSWQTGMLMTDLRDFYFTLAFSLINNLMAFFFLL